jgi:transposase
VQVMFERCAGGDVHKKMIVVHVEVPGRSESRTFGTTTAELLQLTDWLLQEGVTHFAMESTGVYWKPLYNLLEPTPIVVYIVNAAHMKAVPGRKTDRADAAWICDLMRHGLLKPSFIPPRPQRELREVVRYRLSLIQERSAEANRIQKVLEGGNIKLGSVVSDILGVSSRQMLTAIVHGEDDPQVLAGMARGRLQNKHEELVQALTGRLNQHQRWMLQQQLEHVAFLDAKIAELDKEVAKRLDPFEDELERLQTITGVKRRVAEVIVSELGVDMSRFADTAHVSSWSGMCPGSHESAGKRRSGRARKGNKTLRAALVTAAHAAGRTRGTFLGDTYHRIAARRGKKRAAVAVGRRILEAAYIILRDGVTYNELGPNHYDEVRREVVTRNAIRRLQRLGYKVTVEVA